MAELWQVVSQAHLAAAEITNVDVICIIYMNKDIDVILYIYYDTCICVCVNIYKYLSI